MKKSISLIMSCVFLSACGGVATVGKIGSDETVVHGRAYVHVSNGSSNSGVHQRSSASTTVTYTNAPSTTFTINAASLVPGSFTGTTLSLGSVTVSSLQDNNLKVCNPGGNTKCTQGIIRVYTTGTVAGFVNTVDLYGAPVYTGTLNPTTQVGLNSVGAVQVELTTIASSTHALNLSAFPSPTYSVNSDFSNAGAGNYSMVYVVEYALAP